MTFLVNDRSTGGSIPAVAITITQNADGTIAFALNVLGSYTGDLRGFFFDLADESRLGTLSVTPTTAGFTEFRQGDDSIKDLGNSANMQGLLGSDGGYDAGIEIGTAGIRADDYRSFSFTLASSTGVALTLEDFSNVDFGVRLTSVGAIGGERDDAAKLLETTSRAIDAGDDANTAAEDGMPVDGNVFSNDANLNRVHLVTAVNGSGANVGKDIQGAYGTLHLNWDGSYIYTLDNSKTSVQGLAAGEKLYDTFSYTAKNFDELTSFSTDSAKLDITITGTNDAPVITDGVDTGAVTDPGGSGVVSTLGTLTFTDLDLTDTHTVSITPVHESYLGALTAVITAPGEVTWTFAVSSQDVAYLAAHETLTQTYTISLDDGAEGAATQRFSLAAADVPATGAQQTITITITGTNDAPDITGGTTTGLVYEDGGRVATGQLAAVDVDNGPDVLAWDVTAQGSRGFATVDATGKWTYTLRNEDQAVQALAQGTAITDTFTVRARDEHQAFDQQMVTVQITGTNDRPSIFVIPPPPPLPPLPAPSVTEDATQSVTRQVSTFDVDALDTRTLSVSQGTPLGYRANFLVSADEFSITRNGAALLHDTFDDGVPPPLGPFSATPPYFTTGVLEESGGRVIFRGEKTGTFRGAGFDGLVAGMDALLNTNIDSSNSVNGLKRDHDFTVEAVFDLVVALERRQGYGLSLSESNGGLASQPTTQSGDDLLDFGVRRDSLDGQVYVRLSTGSAVTDTSNQVQRMLLPLDTGADQIRLRLTHAAGTGEIEASYVLLRNGAPIATTATTFTEHARIFGTDTPDFPADDERYTRASLTVFGPEVNEHTNNIAGLYGTLSVQQDGNYTYALNNSAANVQALAQGEVVTDAFHIRVTDSHGYSAALPVNITVNGVNDAPIITGGVTTGQVYEDGGARVATGQLTAFDVDHNAALTWGLGVGAPAFGFVSMNGATGQWTYSLNSGAVQHLAQGISITDTFAVSVTDQHFATSSPQTVTVTITGTNDRPNLPPAPLAFSVFEDGGPAIGQTSAFDVDNGGMLHWSLNRGSALGYFSDYEFRADSFRIIKNNALLFNDEFDAGGPPPQAPDFLLAPPPGGSSATNYSTTGGLQEIGGKLVFRGSDALAFRGTGNNNLVVGSEAILNTNINPADTQSGLKKNHQFVIEGVFDLVEPHITRQQYGLQLTDGFGQLADDLVNLQVRRETDGLLYVRLGDNNAVLDTSSLVARQLLVPGAADQIRLRLSHAANADSVSASYELIDNDIAAGFIVGGGTLGQVGIFGTDTAFAGDDNNWIRAGLIANALDTNEFVQTITSNYGTLTVGNSTFNNIGDLTYTANGSDVHALAQGESALDTMFVRVVDQFGMSSAQRVDVTVNGVNDAPTISAADASGTVVEDANTTPAPTDSATASGTISFRDVDLRDGHTATFAPAPTNGTALGLFALGSLIEAPNAADGSVGWTYTLDNAAAQYLEEGQSVTEIYTVTLQDDFGGTATREVAVTIQGSADGGNQAPQAFADTNGADAVIESGFALGAPAGDAFASGNVLTNDVDPDPNPGLRVTALNGVPVVAGVAFAAGTFGGLQLMADGAWSYTLHDFDADTNALAQDEAASDQFTYTVSDQAGASSTTTLTIAIRGTNDFPTLEAAGNTGNVTEDGASTTGGHLVGSDPDHGAVLTFGLPFQPTNVHSADYLFGIDHFTVTRLRPGIDSAPTQILNDDFGDGAPPPNGLFSNGNPAYFSTGAFTEVGGRALMNGGVAQGTFPFGGPITVGHTTVATTNNSTDETQGLRISHSFDAMGRFDAELPQRAGQAYGIALTDQRTGNGGDDHIQLLVRHDVDGVVRVVLREGDAAANSITPIDSIALEAVADGDQIVLHLTHDPSQPGTIVGSFELFHGTQIVQSHTFAGTGQIFGTETPGTSDDEPFTRAMFLATSPAQTFSRTGTFGTLVLDESGEWQYVLNNADPDTQALAQGASAIESFDALAIDQFRTAGIRPIQVTVHGTNDRPVAVGDVVHGQVSEDAPALINVLANDRDVDAGDLIRVAGYDALSFYGAAISLNPDGTFRYDPTSAQALQALNAGHILVDTFTYAITDERESSLSATVSVTVAGVTDLNSPPIAVADNNDHDLVVEAGVNFLGAALAGDPTASGNVLANDSDPDAGQVLRVAAVNGSAAQVGALLTLTYGSLSINADGTWTYVLDNSDRDTNELRQLQPVFAEPGVEQVAYTVADQHGATATQVLTIRVSGTNDAPVVVADSNSAIEDVVSTVIGNVLANDSDPEGSGLQVISPPGALPGRYGTLTLNPDGSYSYQVNPLLVNFLAAGEVAHDIFEQRYSVMEQGFGASVANNATLLDIAITGTDEAPSFADGVVFEDGARGTTGHVDLSAASTWSVTGAGPMTPWADYRFRIDNLNIVKSGSTFVNDDFGNGAPPPSGPGFNYLTGGTFTETGNRANMDGSFSVVTAPGFVGHSAILNTDTTADLNSGLKRNHDFKVEARFDLVIPDQALQTYGIRLSDSGVPGGGDDVVEIAVRRMEDGSVAVILREGNVIGAPPAILAAIPLGNQATDNRIVLRLEHTANTDQVRGSFDLMDGDLVRQTTSFGTTVGQIFGNEAWTRAQFVGFSPSQPQNGAYGTLSVEADGEWTYSLNNGIANVQALAQGERLTDSFTVRVTDALGMSETQTVSIDVVGTNDTPFGNVGFSSPPAPGTAGAYVIEDGAQQTARGTGFGSDIDHGHPMQWAVTANTVAGSVTAYSADYLFKVDELSITRDGAAFLLDTFNDGVPPPASAPTFNYILTGGFSEPSGGGRAILDGHRGGAISGAGTPEVIVANVAVLDTNLGDASPGRGLKSHHDFTIEARFDLDPLSLPSVGQAFGLSLSDRSLFELPLEQLGDDIVGLLVTRDALGNLVVAFEERDGVADGVNILDSELLATPLSASQIVLRLEHDKDDGNFGLVQASFEVITGGMVTHEWRSIADTQRADRIFGAETPDNPYDDEVWTRAQIWAFGPDTIGAATALGTYGSLSVAPDGDWTYTLNNAAGNVQALSQGQIAVDSFNLRSTDAYGASTSRQFNVNVIGTGDNHAVGLQVNGGAAAETLIGSPFNDLITGNGGGDLLIGLAGSDRFDYNSLGDGADTITDFTPGAGGDVLDIRDLVQGYIPPGAAIPPGTMPHQVVPHSFVGVSTFLDATGQLNTNVSVNSDGVGFDYVPIATLQGVGGLLLEEMIANGNLVLA